MGMDWSRISDEFDDIYVFTGKKTDEASCQRDRIPSGKFDGNGEYLLLHEIGLSN